MCTAVSFLSNRHYFGRNLDLDRSYNECVTITPRNYPFRYRMSGQSGNHYAIIGMACIAENYPLYFDGTNEYGLSMAGLNFPDNCVYLEEKTGWDNITPYELTPWILGQCKSVKEARNKLSRVNLINLPFNENYPLTPLHWLISDKGESIVVEPLAQGIVIHDDPIGVLTNNPPFDYHMQNLCNYLNLTNEIPNNRFSQKINLKPYSLGMGAMGMPGDLSSSSRFIRAAFTKMNSPDDENTDSISQFFHILASVAQQYGCVKTNDGFEKTIYSSCCDTEKGIYYYTTYNNSRIRAVDIHSVDLESDRLYTFPNVDKQDILYLNEYGNMPR